LSLVICCLHLPPAAAVGSGGPDRMLHLNVEGSLDLYIF
jgi:hypothetical protein